MSFCKHTNTYDYQYGSECRSRTMLRLKSLSYGYKDLLSDGSRFLKVARSCFVMGPELVQSAVEQLT